PSPGGPPLTLRLMEQTSSQTIPGTGGGHVFWSPNGRFVAFFFDRKLKKVDILGGPPQILCESPGNGAGGTWNSEGVIVFAQATTGPLFRISSNGGVPVQLTELDKTLGEISHRQPYFLPDERHFLFTVISDKPENSGVYVGSLDSKERKRLLNSNL